MLVPGFARIACCLGVLLLWAGCATSTSFRGDVEWGRMQVQSKVDRPPRPADLPHIRYPEVLLAQGVEGAAEMTFVVDDLGVPRDIVVVSATAPEFGEAATRGLERMRYVPAAVQGRNVSCRVTLTLFFRQS